MGALIEIIINGFKEFSGEIVGGILLAVVLWMFPSLRKIFSKKDDAEMQKLLEIQQALETRHKEELKQREEALKQAEAQKVEEAKRRAEIERQLEEQRKVQEAQNTYEQGKNYYDAEDYERAEPFIRKAAEQGYAEAQNNLGYMFNNTQKEPSNA